MSEVEEFESRRAALQEVLSQKGHLTIEVGVRFTALTAWGEEAARRLECLEEALKHATIDGVTGLLRGQEREHMAHVIRGALEQREVSLILDGTLALPMVRRIAFADPERSVEGWSVDVRALGYTNEEVGMLGGNTLLAICAQEVVTVVDALALPARRQSVLDSLDASSVYRRGGDELLVLLCGPLATRGSRTRDEVLSRVSQRTIPGLDVPPGMAIGTMALHVAMWYTGRFYAWLEKSLPEGKDLVTAIIDMWLAFMDERAAASKFVEYGLLFAGRWHDTERVNRWLTSKLRGAAFSGLTDTVVRDLCASAAARLKEEDLTGARQIFENVVDERARQHIERLVDEARSMPGDDMDLARTIFVLSHVYEIAID